MGDWLVVFGDPFNRKSHAFKKYISAENFDEAVRIGREDWSVVVANVESSTGKFVPNIDLLMVAYDPEHVIGAQHAARG